MEIKDIKTLEDINEFEKTLTTTPVLEEDVYFYDESLFDDKREHYYKVKCYDGVGIGQWEYNDDESGQKIAFYIVVTYPTLQEVKSNERLADNVLDYRGLYDIDIDEINYGDVMMTYGEVAAFVDA